MAKTLDEILSPLIRRLGLGLTAMGVIAISLPVPESAVFSLERTIGVLTAISLWLWSEISSYSHAPHPQDVKLFQQAHKLLNESMNFIKEQDFGDSFAESSIKSFVTLMDEWKGPSARFVDRGLQEAWEDTFKATKAFTQILIERCGYGHNSTTRMTVKTLQDIQQGGRSPQTLKAAKDLNTAADVAVAKWEIFVPLGVKRTQVAL